MKPDLEVKGVSDLVKKFQSAGSDAKSNGRASKRIDERPSSTSSAPLLPERPRKMEQAEQFVNTKNQEDQEIEIIERTEQTAFQAVNFPDDEQCAYYRAPKVDHHGLKLGRSIVMFCASDKRILTVKSGSMAPIECWDVISGSRFGPAFSAGVDITTVASVKGNFVVGTANGCVLVLKLERGIFLTSYLALKIDLKMQLGSRPIIQLVKFGKNLVTIDSAGWMNLINLDLEKLSSQKSALDMISNVAVSDDLICIHGLHGDQDWIEVYNDSMELTARIQVDVKVGKISKLAADIKKGFVISGHEDGHVIIWDAASCQVVSIIQVGLLRIESIFVQDNLRIWLGFSTGRMMVIEWKQASCKQLLEWKGHSSNISGIQQDGDIVLSLDGSSLIGLWDGTLFECSTAFKRISLSYEEEVKAAIFSWNVAACGDHEKLATVVDSVTDNDVSLLVVGMQEIVDLQQSAVARDLLRGRNKEEQNDEPSLSLEAKNIVQSLQKKLDLELICAQSMVGLLIAVFAKRSLSSCQVNMSLVRCGLGGMHGNKGAVAVRLLLGDSSFCFMNCHLAAGQTSTAERNSDAAAILRNLHFPPVYKSNAFLLGKEGALVSDHEHLFFFGDLNYRLNISRDQFASMTTLLRHDQLNKQIRETPFHPLNFFEEGEIEFAPTYKYDPGSDRFDSSEKQRVPSYCDRILYRSRIEKKSRLLSYESIDSKKQPYVQVSDHRPVIAQFMLQVKKNNF